MFKICICLLALSSIAFGISNWNEIQSSFIVSPLGYGGSILSLKYCVENPGPILIYFTSDAESDRCMRQPCLVKPEKIYDMRIPFHWQRKIEFVLTAIIDEIQYEMVRTVFDQEPDESHISLSLDFTNVVDKLENMDMQVEIINPDETIDTCAQFTILFVQS